MSKSQLKPVKNRVIARKLTDEEKGTTSGSGIIVPDTVPEEKETQGVVLGVGPDAEGVKEGDRIVFSSMGTDEVSVGGEELIIVPDNVIFGIIS